MDFKKWYLNEVGTGSNCIAGFARPIFGDDLIKRKWVKPIVTESKDNKEKKD